MKAIITTLAVLLTVTAYSQSIERNVETFKELMIGPGINIELIKSDVEKIHLVSDSPLIKDLTIEDDGIGLRIYFGYKNFSFDDDDDSPANGKYTLENTPYEGIRVYGKIYYKQLNTIDFRGDGKLFSKDDVVTDQFLMKIYGESEVKLSGIKAFSYRLKAFGENEIYVLGGHVEEMKITTYGENEIFTSNLKSEQLKITSFGESEMEVHAAETLNIKVIGEGSIQYSGEPKVKEFNLGEASISRLP